MNSDFCALPCCKACIVKQRPFPQVEEGVKTVKGNICKACDRKFYVRAIIKDKYGRVMKNYEELAGDDSFVLKINHAETTLDKLWKQRETDEKNFKYDCADMKKKIGRFQKEHDAASAEQKKAMRKIEDKIDQKRELDVEN